MASIEQLFQTLYNQQLTYELGTAFFHQKIYKKQFDIGLLYLKYRNTTKIAQVLNLHIRTVQAHLNKLSQKLLVNNGIELYKILGVVYQRVYNDISNNQKNEKKVKKGSPNEPFCFSNRVRIVETLTQHVMNETRLP